MHIRDILLTALAPVSWGTTYVVTTEFLPPHRPLLVATLRALPLGQLIIASTRRLPRGDWWWRAFVLGWLNIGLFFALLFFAAYRLPGGIAATIGAIQPLVVLFLSAGLLNERLSTIKVVAASAGIVGVGLLVLGPDARLDMTGIAAALGGTGLMATGTVLTKRWERPIPLLVFTSWQLVAGGLLLLPIALIVEGLPPALTVTNAGGFIYLGLINTGLAYALWFRGIGELKASAVTFLALLSPAVAVLVDFVFLGKILSLTQFAGIAIILCSIVAAQRFNGHKRSQRKTLEHHSHLITRRV